MASYTQYRYVVQEETGPSQALTARHRLGAGIRGLACAVWDAFGETRAWSSFDRMPDPGRHPECWFRLV